MTNGKVQIPLSASDLAALNLAADRLECSRHRLVSALMRCVIRDDMIDAILDGESPNSIIPEAMRTGRPRGSQIQDKVLSALREQAGRKRTITISLKKIGDLVDADTSYVCSAVRRLMDLGRIERTEAPIPKAKKPATYRILGEN